MTPGEKTLHDVEKLRARLAATRRTDSEQAAPPQEPSPSSNGKGGETLLVTTPTMVEGIGTAPLILAPDFKRIPSELTALKQWVCWRRIMRDGKATKVPFMPNGVPASSRDLNTWSPFKAVVDAYQRGGFDGIGFVFAGQHWGADFDHVTDAAGHVLDPEIEKEVRALAVGAYCERSVSGLGVHVIGLYRGEPLPGRKIGPREGYTQGRYFTITGQPVPGIESPR